MDAVRAMKISTEVIKAVNAIDGVVCRSVDLGDDGEMNFIGCDMGGGRVGVLFIAADGVVGEKLQTEFGFKVAQEDEDAKN